MRIAALIISMIALCFALLSFLHNDYTHINHDTKHYQTHSPDTLPETCVIQGKPHPITSKECAEQARYRESHNLSKNDFIAQKNMALYALLGLIVGSVGLCIVGLTLNETKKAAKAANATLEQAQQATEAARDNVAVTRDIGQKQVRAYLSAEKLTFKFTDTIPETKISFKNSGGSPAFGVSVYRVCYLINAHTPNGYFSGAGIDGHINIADIMSASSTELMNIQFPIGEYTDNYTGEPVIFSNLTDGNGTKITIDCLGRISFRDIFDVDREEAFWLRGEACNIESGEVILTPHVSTFPDQVMAFRQGIIDNRPNNGEE